MQPIIFDIVSQEVTKSVAEAIVFRSIVHPRVRLSEALCNVDEPHCGKGQHEKAKLGGNEKTHYAPEVQIVGHSVHTLHVGQKVKDGVLIRSEDKDTHAGPKKVKGVVIARFEVGNQVIARECNRRSDVQVK